MKNMKFRRRGWYKHKRIGMGKKRKVGWRKPKGRDNKMREKRKGRPPVVSIGYKKAKTKQKVVMIYNIKDIEGMEKGNIAILGKVGKRKKMEIAKKAQEKNIGFQNLNIKKFLKKNESK